jgi:hypothetical protein
VLAVTSLEAIIRNTIRDETGAGAMKRIINGFEVDWARSQLTFGYLHYFLDAA